MRQSESLNLKMGIVMIALGMLVALSSGLALGVEKSAQGGKTAGDEFFIISSVDMKSQQLVLKRPTEVTELMTVDAKTQILNEERKPITLKNLRAGDTVFIASRPTPNAERIATRIRQGPMTL
jgi:hypothetical protein